MAGCQVNNANNAALLANGTHDAGLKNNNANNLEDNKNADAKEAAKEEAAKAHDKNANKGDDNADAA